MRAPRVEIFTKWSPRGFCDKPTTPEYPNVADRELA